MWKHQLKILKCAINYQNTVAGSMGFAHPFLGGILQPQTCLQPLEKAGTGNVPDRHYVNSNETLWKHNCFP